MLDRPQRRGAILILVVGLAWLVAAAVGTALATGLDPTTLDPPALARYVATIVVRFAPPVAVTLLAVELIRRAGSRDDEAMAELEARTAAAAAAGQAVRDGLLDLDATLTAIGGRLDDLRAATATETPKLTAAAREVEALSKALAATGERTVAAAHGLGDALPRTQAAADRVAETLAAAGGAMTEHVDATDAALGRVADRQAAVGAQADTMTAATLSAAAAIGERTATLDAAVDAALTRTAAALDAVRDGVDAQAKAMLGSVDAARAGLDAIGGGSAGVVRARIDHIVAASASLGTSLADHDARTAALIATIERSFTVLDKRLAHAAAMGTATLDAFETRMAAVRDAADAVPARLDAAAGRLSEIEGAAARLAVTAGTAEGLAGHLAAAASPAQRLAADLAEARAAVAGIEEAAHGSALAGAHQLIEVLGRVREVAAAAAGTLRDTLAEVVAEAETALADAGGRTAAHAFADPIRHEIAGLEGAAALAGEAAQATADRIAARLLGLTQVVATVERRLAEVAD